MRIENAKNQSTARHVSSLLPASEARRLHNTPVPELLLAGLGRAFGGFGESRPLRLACSREPCLDSTS